MADLKMLAIDLGASSGRGIIGRRKTCLRQQIKTLRRYGRVAAVTGSRVNCGQ